MIGHSTMARDSDRHICFRKWAITFPAILFLEAPNYHFPERDFLAVDNPLV